MDANQSFTVDVLKHPTDEDWTNIKDKLLETGFFVENEFLYKYCDLIRLNRDTKQEKFKTQKHHILPRTYFKEVGIEQDDTQDNIVNLYFSDHALAHYYLTLCVKECRLKYKLLCAFKFIYGANKEKMENIAEFDTQIDLQTTYEEIKRNTSLYRTGYKNKPMSEQGRKNISNAHKGMTPPNKGKPMSKEQRGLLSKIHRGRPKSEAWKQSRRHKSSPHTEEHKKKISNSLIGHAVSDETKKKIGKVNKNKKWMTNGKETVLVKENDISSFLERGFVYGRKLK